MMSCSLKKEFTSRNKKLAVSREAYIILAVVRDMNENTINVAKGIFGFVFENRNELNLPIYRTLMHDLGIIIRDDKMAVPYTVDKQSVVDELVN